ncbi:MAG: immunoglobulin domain-containing protein [Acidobacteriota bacterium]
MKTSFRLLALAAVVLVAGSVQTARAQAVPSDSSPLRDAQAGEVWITQPTLAGSPLISTRGFRQASVADTTPPSAPGGLVAGASGLFLIEATWTDAVDAESGIHDYAFAVGTGTGPESEANVTAWRSNGVGKKVKINLALTQGTTYFFSVRATNGAGLSSSVVRSAPLTAAPRIYGETGNRISYTIASAGLAADGTPTASWPAEKAAALSAFMDQMLPVLHELYGPPATNYTVSLLRDLRYTASAVFFPSTDEIHAGDTITYQLLTHELVHAFRRDQILSSGSTWQFDPTLSGFEEGFAQAVSYEAMTEFARRYPSFGLTQQVYQSSNEWDYDFQNVPELRTRDFWSDSGGMLLYWTRYEMASAAIAKIEREHPGFHRAFNAEYFRRLNTDPRLTPSRDLVMDIIRTVAPTIEGRPALQWIGQQNVFDCADHPGKKVWLSTQHYPAPADYFIFNRIFFYETFSNGSDWSAPNPAGGYDYYRLNGSSGTATFHASSGSVVWQTALTISPTENPPAYYGFGNENVSLTTQPTNLPWPGGDSSRYATNLVPFDLYRLNVQLTSGTTVTSNSYRVIGAAIRNTMGIFGGIVGANGGTISLNHRSHPAEPPVPVVNGVFQAAPSWASQLHPETASLDTDPGIVDVTYVDATGVTYTDVRVIGYGSVHGNETFLFDVARMSNASQSPVSIVSQPSSRAAMAGQSVQFAVVATGAPAPVYQWQVSTNAGSSWTNLADGGSNAGARTPVLALGSVTLGMNATQYRVVATNALGVAVSSAAALGVSPSGRSAASFYPVSACRAFDSRNISGPDAAAPALAAGVSRVFPLEGRCGIPATAAALSVNVTVTQPTAAGSIVLYPGDEPVPVASTVSFRAGQTRANNAIIKIAGDGSGTLGISNGAPGSVQFIVDVNGYFE